MLKILNRNKVATAILEWCQDCVITRKLEMDDRTLQFSITQEEFATSGIELEGYIQKKDSEEFVIREINKSSSGVVSITAPLNVEELEGKICDRFLTMTGQISVILPTLFINNVPAWSCIVTSSAEDNKERTISLENSSMYEALKNVLSTFNCECRINPSNRTVTVYKSIGSDRGAYLTNELNLRSMEITSNSYDFYTEIEPYGKDGLDISSVTTGGVKYLSNYTYSNKKKRCVWKDERCTDAATLMGDAENKLADLCKPKATYSVEIIDLAKMSGAYSFLNFSVGDTVRIIDNYTRTQISRRITEITEHPFEPDKNSCVIGDPRPNYEELIESIHYSTGAITNPYDLTSGTELDLTSGTNQDDLTGGE